MGYLIRITCRHVDMSHQSFDCAKHHIAEVYKISLTQMGSITLNNEHIVPSLTAVTLGIERALPCDPVAVYLRFIELRR